MTYAQSIRAERDAWRRSVPQRCMLCGGDYLLAVHEIERRSAAPKRWAHPCNYLLLDQNCHDKMGNTYWPQARQLALKLLTNPTAFDLDTWLRLKDPELLAPNRVTLQDVMKFLELSP